MSANRIFLVCSHHPSIEDALLLSERMPGNTTHEPPLKFSHQAAWFERHARCGNPDDFQLAFQRPQNWDVSPPAQDTVAGAVRLGIINGGKPS